MVQLLIFEEDLERMLRVDLVRALVLLLAVASAHARECTLSHVYNLDAEDELRGGAPPLLDIMAQDIRLGGSKKYDFCAVRHHQPIPCPPTVHLNVCSTCLDMRFKLKTGYTYTLF